MIGKTTLLGYKGYEMWADKEFPLKNIYQLCSRVPFQKNIVSENKNGQLGFAWFVWERGYKGKPTINWIK